MCSSCQSSGLSPALFLSLEWTVFCPGWYDFGFKVAWLPGYDGDVPFQAHFKGHDIHEDTYWFSVFHLTGESLVQARLPSPRWPAVSQPSLVPAWGESWGFWLLSAATCVTHFGDRGWIKSVFLTYHGKMCYLCHGYQKKNTPRHTFYCRNPASSRYRVEDLWGRNKTARCSCSRGEPLAFPTTFLDTPST